MILDYVALTKYRDYYYNADETIKAPLAVRVAEARLVDGMIPLSKFTVGRFLNSSMFVLTTSQAGKTGKSVARSYLSTLDLMVPVEASVSGLIGGSDPKAVVEDRLVVIRDRYNRAMEYLKSADDSPNAEGRSKLGTYVLKQESWSKAVEAYTAAQDRALASVKPPTGATRDQVKEARELYLQWIQEHGRDVSLTSVSDERYD